MDEAPEGLEIPQGRIAKPRNSVSILLTRDGANGIVILRMATTRYTGTTSGSPTVVVDGSDTVLIFNSSGSYTA